MNLPSLPPAVRHPVRTARERRARSEESTALEQRRERARRVLVRRRRGLAAGVAFGGLALVFGLPLLMWQGPHLFDGKYLDEAELRKGSAALVTGLRTSMVALVAAIGAGVALLYTARTYRLTRRGQITDRFTKALERLGSPEVYVRIGGILALEQIVQDAPEQAATDAARVLGHFIRDRAPKARPTGAPDEPEGEGLPERPAADVQAALTALTRPESRTHVDARERLDLAGLHLAGADLGHADLTGARMTDATLAGADLLGATLTGADLRRATLTRTGLAGATLTKACLVGATLTRADLRGATLTRTDLWDATLTGALLWEATLTEANLRAARLTGADLRSASLTGADLVGAALTRAYLVCATLTGADLWGATLAEADLDGVTLTGANLADATLTQAKGLTVGQVSAARVSRHTVLPERFYPSVDPAGPEA
ncbi:pentapeptide repeat-containing protein [Streptomyces sp. NPDC001941]|uniref:pentapeptide repeat-containing protein n=1 Tax=Streptomyces sp. NPDC001941 TaxID=3154659 RepID=UPI003332BD66